MVIVAETSISFIGYYYSLMVGCIISIIATIFMSLKTAHSFMKQRNVKNLKPLSYILFGILCTLILWTSFCFLFIKANIFTTQSASTYTLLQCNIGYYGIHASTWLIQIIMYSLFIYRLHIVFENTPYAYSRCTFITLCSILFVGLFLSVLFMCLGSSELILSVWRFGNTNQLYCDSYEGEAVFFVTLSFGTFILWQFGYGIVLLYMFTKRLRALKLAFISQYVAESTVELADIESPRSIEEQRSNSANIPDHRIEMIAKLHGLIKKHTILVYTTIFAQLLWIVSTYAISPWMWLEIIWPLLVTIACIWLMFAEADPYWKLFTKYGCCYFCYRNTKKEEKNICGC
eukprot:511314_1